MIRSTPLTEDLELFIEASKTGQFYVMTSLLSLYTFEVPILMIAYYHAKKRALKLKSNKLGKDNLIQQGIESNDCAEYLFNLFTPIVIPLYITLFAYVLCKLNYFNQFYDFIKNHTIDYNFKAKDGITMLHVASKKGNVDIVNYLLKLNVQLNEQERIFNKTPLHYAVKNYHYPVVTLLLEYNANPNIKDSHGKTPLHYVAPGPFGNDKMFSLLLDYGADINKKVRHSTLLYYAVQQNRNDGVQYLLEKGANPFIPSRLPKINNQLKRMSEVPLSYALKANYADDFNHLNNCHIIILLNRAMFPIL